MAGAAAADANLVLQNLLSPPVMFFFLGGAGAVLGSDLEMPGQIKAFLSTYLLLAIGFKGGVELANVGLERRAVLTILAAVAMACAVPAYTFAILRRWLRLDVANAAAVAAAYGSISAVTFITAESFLGLVGEPFDGYMVAALALMESPAIVVGLYLLNTYGGPHAATGGKARARAGSDTRPPKAAIIAHWYDNRQQKQAAPEHDRDRDRDRDGARARSPATAGATAGAAATATTTGAVLREACLNSSVFVLVGSLAIGLLGQRFSPTGVAKMQPFVGDLFYGFLALFLLDMGVVAARRLQDLRKAGAALVVFSVAVPLVNAAGSIFVAVLLGLSRGNALLFTVLGASASYIAVPAALRVAVPAASPTIYLTTALGITFPFNVVVGIPFYMAVINAVISAGPAGGEGSVQAAALTPNLREMGRAFMGGRG